MIYIVVSSLVPILYPSCDPFTSRSLSVTRSRYNAVSSNDSQNIAKLFSNLNRTYSPYPQLCSCLKQLKFQPHPTNLTAIVERSLGDLISQAAALCQQKELLTKEQWQELTLQYKRSFVNNMVKLYRWWQDLSQELRDRLLSIPCKYVPFNGIMQVVKIPTKCLEKFLATCEERVTEYLAPNSNSS